MDGLAARANRTDRSAAATRALPLKRDFILIGSPTEVNCRPFSAPRESVLSYYSTSGSRSLKRRQPELGACILDAGAERNQ